MSYHVLEHHLAHGVGAYRIVIGHGEPQDPTPVTDEDGDPVLVPGTEEPMMEEAPDLILHVEDFLFAADDKRWDGKTDEEIAAEQRADVLAALQNREEQAEVSAARAASVRDLPGVGETL